MTLTNPQGPTYPVDFDGYNTTGSTIPAGTAVRIDGAATHPDLGYALPTLALAQADDPGTMSAAGITIGEIESGYTGTVRAFGIIYDLDTSAFSNGDPVYVSPSVAGELVNGVGPPADISQRIGAVVLSDATAGQIFAFIDQMMDGDVSYTNRDQFEINSPTTASSTLRMSVSGGDSIDLIATPTDARFITLPDATTDLIGNDTTDTLTNKRFPDNELRVESSGDATKAMLIRNIDTLTADRKLNITLGDAARDLTLTGNATISGTHSGAASGTNTGDQTITLTGDVTGTGTGSFAATIANNAVTMAKLENGSAVGHTLKAGATDPSYVAAGILFRREWQFLANPGAATGTVVGLVTAPTLSGTVSNVDSNTRPLVRHVTGTTSGNSAGVLSGFDVVRSGWLSKTSFVIQTGASLSSGRWWFGFTTADLTGVATPTTQHVAAFSYDTGRDGTVFWRTITNDGVGAATVTATTTAIATATTYNLRIEMNGATNVLFYIDDVLVNTHTTTLPAVGSILGFQMSATTLTTGAGTAKRFEWSRVGGEQI